MRTVTAVADDYGQTDIEHSNRTGPYMPAYWEEGIQTPSGVQ